MEAHDNSTSKQSQELDSETVNYHVPVIVSSLTTSIKPDEKPEPVEVVKTDSASNDVHLVAWKANAPENRYFQYPLNFNCDKTYERFVFETYLEPLLKIQDVSQESGRMPHLDHTSNQLLRSSPHTDQDFSASSQAPQKSASSAGGQLLPLSQDSQKTSQKAGLHKPYIIEDSNSQPLKVRYIYLSSLSEFEQWMSANTHSSLSSNTSGASPEVTHFVIESTRAYFYNSPESPVESSSSSSGFQRLTSSAGSLIRTEDAQKLDNDCFPPLAKKRCQSVNAITSPGYAPYADFKKPIQLPVRPLKKLPRITFQNVYSDYMPLISIGSAKTKKTKIEMTKQSKLSNAHKKSVENNLKRQEKRGETLLASNLGFSEEKSNDSLPVKKTSNEQPRKPEALSSSRFYSCPSISTPSEPQHIVSDQGPNLCLQTTSGFLNNRQHDSQPPLNILLPNVCQSEDNSNKKTPPPDIDNGEQVHFQSQIRNPDYLPSVENDSQEGLRSQIFHNPLMDQQHDDKQLSNVSQSNVPESGNNLNRMPPPPYNGNGKQINSQFQNKNSDFLPYEHNYSQQGESLHSQVLPNLSQVQKNGAQQLLNISQSNFSEGNNLNRTSPPNIENGEHIHSQLQNENFLLSIQNYLKLGETLRSQFLRNLSLIQKNCAQPLLSVSQSNVSEPGNNLNTASLPTYIGNGDHIHSQFQNKNPEFLPYEHNYSQQGETLHSQILHYLALTQKDVQQPLNLSQSNVSVQESNLNQIPPPSYYGNGEHIHSKNLEFLSSEHNHSQQDETLRSQVLLNLSQVQKIGTQPLLNISQSNFSEPGNNLNWIPPPPYNGNGEHIYSQFQNKNPEFLPFEHNYSQQGGTLYSHFLPNLALAQKNDAQQPLNTSQSNSSEQGSNLNRIPPPTYNGNGEQIYSQFQNKNPEFLPSEYNYHQQGETLCSQFLPNLALAQNDDVQQPLDLSKSNFSEPGNNLNLAPPPPNIENSEHIHSRFPAQGEKEQDSIPSYRFNGHSEFELKNPAFPRFVQNDFHEDQNLHSQILPDPVQQQKNNFLQPWNISQPNSFKPGSNYKCTTPPPYSGIGHPSFQNYTQNVQTPHNLIFSDPAMHQQQYSLSSLPSNRSELAEHLNKRPSLPSKGESQLINTYEPNEAFIPSVQSHCQENQIQLRQTSPSCCSCGRESLPHYPPFSKINSFSPTCTNFSCQLPLQEPSVYPSLSSSNDSEQLKKAKGADSSTHFSPTMHSQNLPILKQQHYSQNSSGSLPPNISLHGGSLNEPTFLPYNILNKQKQSCKPKAAQASALKSKPNQCAPAPNKDYSQQIHSQYQQKHSAFPPPVQINIQKGRKVIRRPGRPRKSGKLVQHSSPSMANSFPSSSPSLVSQSQYQPSVHSNSNGSEPLIKAISSTTQIRSRQLNISSPSDSSVSNIETPVSGKSTLSSSINDNANKVIYSGNLSENILPAIECPFSRSGNSSCCARKLYESVNANKKSNSEETFNEIVVLPNSFIKL